MKKYNVATFAEFKPLDNEIAKKLVDFSSRKNIDKIIEIDSQAYRLEHISFTPGYYHVRSLSLYFRTRRSVIRISDHWSGTRYHPKSKNFNCEMIASCRWIIRDQKDNVIITQKFNGSKYPFVLLAGICGICGFKQIS